MKTTITAEEYRNSVSKGKPRQQLEGQSQRNFGMLLNGVMRYRLSPNLLFWTYSAAGERKGLKTAVLQKRKGMQKGDFDYRFEMSKDGALRVIYIEFKTAKGSLTAEQKIFMARHSGLKNCACYLARSVEEGVGFLEKEGVLEK